MTRIFAPIAATLSLAALFCFGLNASAQTISAAQRKPIFLAFAGVNAIHNLLQAPAAPTHTAGYTALPTVALRPAIAHKRVTLRLPATETAEVTAIVLDKTGREVAKLPVVRGRMDLRSLAPGAYFLEVQGAATYRATFIKA